LRGPLAGEFKSALASASAAAGPSDTAGGGASVPHTLSASLSRPPVLVSVFLRVRSAVLLSPAAAQMGARAEKGVPRCNAYVSHQMFADLRRAATEVSNVSSVLVLQLADVLMSVRSGVLALAAAALGLR
jgi:hypothetical protein